MADAPPRPPHSQADRKLSVFFTTSLSQYIYEFLYTCIIYMSFRPSRGQIEKLKSWHYLKWQDSHRVELYSFAIFAMFSTEELSFIFTFELNIISKFINSWSPTTLFFLARVRYFSCRLFSWKGYSLPEAKSDTPSTHRDGNVWFDSRWITNATDFIPWEGNTASVTIFYVYVQMTTMKMTIAP